MAVLAEGAQYTSEQLRSGGAVHTRLALIRGRHVHSAGEQRSQVGRGEHGGGVVVCWWIKLNGAHSTEDNYFLAHRS